MVEKEKLNTITNFIGEGLEGYDSNGNPKLTHLIEDVLWFTDSEAEIEISRLHKKGYTGLEIRKGFGDI